MACHIPSAHIIPNCSLEIVASIQENWMSMLPHFHQLFNHCYGTCIATDTFFTRFTTRRSFIGLFKSKKMLIGTMLLQSASQIAHRKLPGMEIVYVNDGHGEEIVINLRNIQFGSERRNTCTKYCHTNHAEQHFDVHFLFCSRLVSVFSTDKRSNFFCIQLNLHKSTKHQSADYVGAELNIQRTIHKHHLIAISYGQPNLNDQKPIELYCLLLNFVSFRDNNEQTRWLERHVSAAPDELINNRICEVVERFLRRWKKISNMKYVRR